jgi:hypothetical protein
MGSIDAEVWALAASPGFVGTAATVVKRCIGQLLLETGRHTYVIAQARISGTAACRIVRVVLTWHILRRSVAVWIIADCRRQREGADKEQGKYIRQNWGSHGAYIQKDAIKV